MTKRSELAHRRAEAQAKLMNSVANKAFSRRDTGLDRVAKSLINRQASAVEVDPDLLHDDAEDQTGT